jgi:small conductance mechanosensitive channel
LGAGLNKALSSILAGIGVIGLAFGFAFQDIAANFLSGIILAFREPKRRHNKTKDVMGTVTKTNLRDTVIETFQAQSLHSNKDFCSIPSTIILP